MASLRRFAPLSLPLLFAFAACSSVLGIEDIHSGPAPGGGASGGTSGGAGGPSVGGGESGNTGGRGGAGGTQVVPSGGMAGKGQGGGTVIGGAGNGEAAGQAGEGQAGAGTAGTGPVDMTVHGHVIDYWGHKVADIPIQIGDVLTQTDAEGAFTVDDVPQTYNVGLQVDFSGESGRETYGWAFLGLTRRDPTLQVYSAFGKRRQYFQIAPKNADVTDARRLSVTLGGADGAEEFSELSGPYQSSTTWRGPVTTEERAHGLLWEVDSVSSLPTGYLGYDTTLVALSDTSSDMAQIPLDLLKTSPIPSGNLVGKVTPASGTDRANTVFLRFDSGAKLQLINDSTGPDTFSYLVPTIANSGVTFAAIEGDAYWGAFAVAHRDGLAPSATSVNLTVPAPGKPQTPNSGAANVDSNSQFTWTSGAGNNAAFVVSMLDEDYGQGLFVVTASKSLSKIPLVPGGPYQFASAHKYDWRMETHGTFASVDAMAGPAGFMDEFSGDNESPRGPRTGDGTFTISQYNVFTAK